MFQDYYSFCNLSIAAGQKQNLARFFNIKMPHYKKEFDFSLLRTLSSPALAAFCPIEWRSPHAAWRQLRSLYTGRSCPLSTWYWAIRRASDSKLPWVEERHLKIDTIWQVNNECKEKGNLAILFNNNITGWNLKRTREAWPNYLEFVFKLLGLGNWRTREVNSMTHTLYCELQHSSKQAIRLLTIL